jgi:MFS family permease
MLRDLHFSYLGFMFNTGTAVFIQFIALNSWGRISDVFGNRLILMVTGMLVPLLPLLWTLTNNFWYLIAVQCLSGLSWAGFSLSTGNLLYELVPAERRSAYVALHNVLVAVAVFTGAMLATLMIGVTPARPTFLGNPHITSVLLNLFLVSTAARLLVAILLLERVRELRRPRRHITPRHFVFRVTRFNAFVGLLYDAIGAVREDRPGTGKGA